MIFRDELRVGWICDLEINIDGNLTRIESVTANPFIADGGQIGVELPFVLEEPALSGRFIYVLPEYMETFGAPGVYEFKDNSDSGTLIDTISSIEVSIVVPEAIHPLDEKYISVKMPENVVSAPSTLAENDMLLYNGTEWTTVNKSELDTPELPTVTTSDNGKFLMVESGVWAAVKLTDVSTEGA